MEERKSFVFYLNWHKVLKKYPAQIRCEVYDAIIEYAASGTLTALKPQSQMAFDFIKDELDENLKKFQSKAEVRRKAANERWNNVRDANYANASDALQNKKCMNLHYENENENVSSNEDIKEKPSKEGKKNTRSNFSEEVNELINTTTNEKYRSYLQWSLANVPYVASHMKPMTEKEFDTLKGRYGSKKVRETLEQIENRKDLRKKYTSTYRTLLNWLKENGYDS